MSDVRLRLRIAGLALAAGALLGACTAQAAPATSGPVGDPVPTTTTPTTTTTTPPPPPPPCAPDVSACVRLSTKEAWLMTNGVADHGPVPIAYGAARDNTPTGTWPVSWKDQENTSSLYGTPMPYSVFFAPGGIAFHEGPVNEDSHGCVRLTMADAQLFFERLQPGMLVQIVR